MYIGLLAGKVLIRNELLYSFPLHNISKQTILPNELVVCNDRFTDLTINIYVNLNKKPNFEDEL